jgi:hypothetical protein
MRIVRSAYQRRNDMLTGAGRSVTALVLCQANVGKLIQEHCTLPLVLRPYPFRSTAVLRQPTLAQCYRRDPRASRPVRHGEPAGPCREFRAGRLCGYLGIARSYRLRYNALTKSTGRRRRYPERPVEVRASGPFAFIALRKFSRQARNNPAARTLPHRHHSAKVPALALIQPGARNHGLLSVSPSP